ncbi:MAG: hypothetical protein HQL54_11990 [Magnetococcales bacterium]|nr:hypothetical protein [Magnetococcales bacterium]
MMRSHDEDDSTLSRLSTPLQVIDDQDMGLVRGNWVISQARSLNQVIEVSGGAIPLDRVAQLASDETAQALYSVLGSQTGYQFHH